MPAVSEQGVQKGNGAFSCRLPQDLPRKLSDIKIGLNLNLAHFLSVGYFFVSVVVHSLTSRAICLVIKICHRVCVKDYALDRVGQKLFCPFYHRPVNK